jgi:hypothetical protein
MRRQILRQYFVAAHLKFSRHHNRVAEELIKRVATDTG